MTTRITELAAIIAANTSKVDDYLTAHGSPQPSFDVDGPADIKFPSDAADIDAARTTAIEASIELQDLLQGNRSLLRPQLNGTSLQAIFRYDIPAKVPIHGEISYIDLAKWCKLYEPDLRRIIRYAITYHRVFCEPRIGFIAHTAASRLLVDEPDMFEGLGGMFDSSWPCYSRTLEAMEHFKSQEPTATAWHLLNNTTDFRYEHKSKNPKEVISVASSMRSFATHPFYAVRFLIDGFDWASLNASTVVDVGGCQGHISIALAEAFPLLEFVVQDLEGMIANAVSKVPPSVNDRVRFMPHNFLEPQTLEADVYLFRWVFHDWPDAYCIKILRNLIPSLKSGARIIISDAIMAAPNSLPLLRERMARAFDMLMLALFNAREREMHDWLQLIKEADKRFVVQSAETPIGSALGIIVVEWVG